MKTKRKRLLMLISFGILLVVILLPIFLVFRLRSEKKEEAKKAPLAIRPAKAAGQFYPEGKGTLKSKITAFLSETRLLVQQGGFLQILIVPHAGYDYSGSVAAWGFGQLEGKNYSNVILIGGSHQAWFEGGVIDENDVWETPLGQVEINKNLAQKIVKEVDGLSFSSSAHAQEHSLEVEIPFLQSFLSDFKIIPLLLAQTDDKLLESLADSLARNITSKTLVVVSTDLSHYPSYEIANEIDKATIDSILTGEVENFKAVISTQLAKGYPGLETCACGREAIKVGMILAKKLGGGEWRLLKYANSGNVSIGDKERVVGYGSVGFYRERAEDQVNLEEQEELLAIARLTLESYLKDKKIPDFEIAHPFLNRNLGAFVTLRKNDQLRGCIGQFEPDIPLWQVVRQKAIDAAVNDIRFPPVTYNELDEIKIEISVLSPQKKIDDWREIELGRHGVVVKKGLRSGVFLPQVAIENNWDLNTFMGQLCSQKVGLSWDCWQKDDVELFTFTAQIFEEEE